MTAAPADHGMRRLAAEVVVRSAAVAGPRRARALAAALMRLEARDDAGWLRGVHRVAAAHVHARTPRLVHVPEAWWSGDPVQRVRRLGLDLELDLRDNLQRVLYFTGRYEPALTAFLRQELRAGDTMLDVGGHIGVHALTAARRLRELGGGRVVAFEPAPDAAALLLAAAGRAGLDVEVVQAAVGAEPGRVQLRSDPGYDRADAGVRSRYGAGDVVAEAPLTSLDAWRAAEGAGPVDLVKIDVEGGELDVVRGMRGVLSSARPRAVVAELKADNRAGTTPEAVRVALATHGYRPVAELPIGNVVFRPGAV